ncbi:MAG: hypothetical protein KDN05_11095, partial [Verrucomicrobiae bacterium]|nr:hypothetical protein [Verrucomicrobiae bacterium]
MASEAGRTVRAIFIQPPDKAPEKALLFMEGGSVEIELPSRNLSPEVDLPAGDLSAFVLSEAPPAGEKPPQGAQLVRIPEAWSRCILLFFPVPDNKAFPARVIPLNASTGDFPLGHTLIYNVSPAKVAAKFGDLRVEVKPGGTASLKPPLARFGDYPVAIDCLFPGDSKPTSICRSQWQHDPEVRQLLFVTPAPGYKVPRVWSILDRPGGKDDR